MPNQPRPQTIPISRQRISQIILNYKKGKYDFLFKKEKELLKEIFEDGLPKQNLKTYSKSQNRFLRYCIRHNYPVLRNGFPDYLMKKKEKWVAVEVKENNKQELSLEQKLMRMFFNSVGVKYKIFTNDKKRKWT